MHLMNWLRAHELPCTYKALFGIDCPLCGFQRSILFLISGDFHQSLRQYPPLIPMLLYAVFLGIIFFGKREKQFRAIKAASIIMLIMISVNYIYKFI